MIAFASFLALVAVCAGPQTPDLGGEGPLQNDAHLDVAAAACKQFDEGDRALAELASKASISSADRERALNRVFEAWHAAIAASALGDSVAVHASASEAASDPSGANARRSQGVELALCERVSRLRAEDRAAWRARFEPLAGERLQGAGSNAVALAALERELPGTLGAARAALELFDLEFERGRFSAARTWARRGVRDWELAGADDAPLARAFELRRSVLPANPSAPTDDAWRSARSFARSGVWHAESARAIADDSPRSVDPSAANERILPGATFLASGRVLAVWPDFAITFDPALPEKRLSFDPHKSLVELFGIDAPRARGSDGEPPWALTPIALAEDALLVVGRADRGRSNAIGRFEPPSDAPVAKAFPTWRWVVAGDRWIDASGKSETIGAELSLERAEIQPGAVVADDQLLVLVRRRTRSNDAGASDPTGLGLSAHEVETWVWALDLESGRPLWNRELARGIAGPRSDAGRRDFALSEVDAPTAALLDLGDSAFAPTNTGFGCALELGDGRPTWSVKIRRRDASVAGPRSTRAFADVQRTRFLWTPNDSDRVYALGPQFAELQGSAATVREIDSIRSAVDFDGRTALIEAARDGRAWLSTVDLQSGARVDSLNFDASSAFTGAAIASPLRVLVGTLRGVLCFDRTRELYLLAKIELPQPCLALAARGRFVVALGDSTVGVLAAR